MKQILIILVLGLIVSCDFSMQKVYDEDIPETPKMLGLYCIFSPDSVWKVQVFKLGSISDYEYDNSQLLVNDAQIKLFCNNQFQENLINIGNGIFVSNSENKPLAGHSYHIEVSKDCFPDIISDTASVLPKLRLDSIFLLEEPEEGLFSDFSNDEFEEGMQLNFYFKNFNNFPFIINNAGWDANDTYFNYEINRSTMRKIDTLTPENELKFFRCYSENCYNDENFNILKLSYISDAYFEFDRGEYIQDDVRGSIISYYPGNVQSNIKNGLGLFTPVNYIEIDVDTLEIR